MADLNLALETSLKDLASMSDALFSGLCDVQIQTPKVYKNALGTCPDILTQPLPPPPSLHIRSPNKGLVYQRR